MAASSKFNMGVNGFLIGGERERGPRGRLEKGVTGGESRGGRCEGNLKLFSITFN